MVMGIRLEVVMKGLLQERDIFSGGLIPNIDVSTTVRMAKDAVECVPMTTLTTLWVKIKPLPKHSSFSIEVNCGDLTFTHLESVEHQQGLLGRRDREWKIKKIFEVKINKKITENDIPLRLLF